MRRAAASLLLIGLMPLAHATEPPLRGTAWVQGAGPAPTITLAAGELRMTGQAQCNRIMGSFTLDGDRLAFGGVASTRRACFPDDGSEAAFLKALSEVRRWRIHGGELLLLAEGGTPLLRLRAGPAK